MTNLQMIAIAAGALVIIILLAMFINLFKQMTRFALAVGAVLALTALIAVVLLFMPWPTLPNPSLEIIHHADNPTSSQLTAPVLGADIQPKQSPSAAVTIRRFLVGLIVVGLLGAAAAIIIRHLWHEHKRRTRLQNTLTQAQIYALLNGQTTAQGMLPRRLSQGGGNVIVVGSQQDIPTQTYLPDGQGWEVL